MRNKKGFTLIELLAVITILVVLISVIMTYYNGATDIANAATNAANLRAIEAEAASDYLFQMENNTGFLKYDPAEVKFTPTDSCPKCRHCGDVPYNAELKIEIVDGVVRATFGEKDVTYFSEKAKTRLS